MCWGCIRLRCGAMRICWRWIGRLGGCWVGSWGRLRRSLVTGFVGVVCRIGCRIMCAREKAVTADAKLKIRVRSRREFDCMGERMFGYHVGHTKERGPQPD